MRDEPLVEIVTTVATAEEALTIARALVEEGAAACVSLDDVRSIYRWQGETCDERETRLVVKTTAAAADRAEARIRELHPYDTPAIVRLAVEGANAAYAEWVREAVSGGDDR